MDKAWVDTDKARIDPPAWNFGAPPQLLISISGPQVYDFTPLDDMTPVEAAWIGIIVGTSFRTVDLPQNHPRWDIIKRHFTAVA